MYTLDMYTKCMFFMHIQYIMLIYLGYAFISSDLAQGG